MKARSFIVGTTLMSMSINVQACLVCETSAGQRVRAGIWDENFLSNLLLTALPFVVFAGIIALLRFGIPSIRPVKAVAATV